MFKHPFYMCAKRFKPSAEYFAVSVIIWYAQLEILIPRLGVKIQFRTFFIAKLVSGRRKNSRKSILRHRKIIFLNFTFPVLNISVLYKKMYKVLDVYAPGLQIAYLSPYIFEALHYFGERNTLYSQTAVAKNVFIYP